MGRLTIDTEKPLFSESIIQTIKHRAITSIRERSSKRRTVNKKTKPENIVCVFPTAAMRINNNTHILLFPNVIVMTPMKAENILKVVEGHENQHPLPVTGLIADRVTCLYSNSPTNDLTHLFGVYTSSSEWALTIDLLIGASPFQRQLLFFDRTRPDGTKMCTLVKHFTPLNVPIDVGTDITRLARLLDIHRTRSSTRTANPLDDVWISAQTSTEDDRRDEILRRQRFSPASYIDLNISDTPNFPPLDNLHACSRERNIAFVIHVNLPPVTSEAERNTLEFSDTISSLLGKCLSFR